MTSDDYSTIFAVIIVTIGFILWRTRNWCFDYPVYRFKHKLLGHKWRNIKVSNSAISEWIAVCDNCDLIKKTEYGARGEINRSYRLDSEGKKIRGCDSSWQG